MFSFFFEISAPQNMALSLIHFINYKQYLKLKKIAFDLVVFFSFVEDNL